MKKKTRKDRINKLNYIVFLDDVIQINFPKNISSTSFENIIQESFKNTFENKIKQIVFSLKNVQWCDIFELSLLALWIDKLLKESKKVVFIYPKIELDKDDLATSIIIEDEIASLDFKQNEIDKYNNCYGFFIKYRFEEYFSSKKIEFRNVRKNISSQFNYHSPFYTLTKLNKNVFTNLEKELRKDARFNNVFNEGYDFEIVKSGKIRDVVLHELGENIVKYAKGKDANMIMTLIGMNSKKRSVWNSVIINNYFNNEKDFFIKLSDYPYIEIVISDNGQGILNTLKKAYLNDKIIEQKKDHPTEIDILKYSLLPHSTSRSLEERMEDIKDDILKEIKDFNPTTGLHRLKETIRRFRGYLAIRSGRSIISFDFLNKPQSGNGIADDCMTEISNLVNYGGTQFKIYIPLIPDLQEQQPKERKFSFRESQLNKEYLYINLSSHFKQKYNADTQELFLYSVYQELDRLSSITSKKDIVGLIVDFSYTEKINSKILQVILRKVLLNQSVYNKANVALNVESEIVLSFNSSMGNQIKHDEIKPLIVFDQIYNRNLIGCKEEDRLEFYRIIEGKEYDKNKLNVFIKKYNFLFDHNLKNGNYSFIHNRTNIINNAAKSIEEILSQIIINQSSNVYFPNVKVFLKNSGKYCLGYFEIYNLLINNNYQSLIKQWITYKFIELKPDYVISIGSAYGNLINELLDELSRKGKYKLKHINIETPLNYYKFLSINMDLASYSKIIIFTDVISTGNTLKKVIENLPKVKISYIYTIVDAPDIELEHSDLFELRSKTESIVNKPTHYYDFLPPEWTYSELQITDESTHVLLKSSEAKDGTLFQDYGIKSNKVYINEEEVDSYENNFLNEIIVKKNAYYYDHVITNDKHLTYLFDIPLILENYEDDIVKIIQLYMKQELTKRKSSLKNVNNVIYLNYNLGLAKLANKVSQRFPNSSPIALSSRELNKDLVPENEVQLFKGKTVLILDDALIKGESIMKLIDFVEERGIKSIFIFILINRSNNNISRRFKKIGKYGSSEVIINYIFNAELPGFVEESCPFCKKHKILEKRLVEVSSIKYLEPYRNYLTNELLKFGHKNLESIKDLKQLTHASNKKMIIHKWKLELSKYLENLSVRKEISSLFDDPQNNKDDIFSIFKILENEKNVFLKNTAIKSLIFYTTFENKIIGAINYYLNNMQTISDENISNLIAVALEFDSNLVFNNIEQIFEGAILHDKKIFIIINLLFEIKYYYPDRISWITYNLKEYLFNNKSENNTNIIMLKEIAAYLEDNIQRTKKRKNIRIDAIKKLLIWDFHDLNKIYGKLEEILDKSGKDIKSGIKNYWNKYDEQIETIINHLDNYLNDNLGDKIVKPLHRIKNELYTNLIIARNILENKECDNKSLLAIIVDINTKINADKGLNNYLEQLVIELKSLINYFFDKYKSKFLERGINIIPSIPEYSLLVYGNLAEIHLIFENLFDNIYKHSKATKFLFVGEINESSDTIILNFYDDGNVNEKIKYGVGLSNVETNTSRNLGSFSIKKIDVEDPYYKLEYRTLARVELLHIDRK